MSSTYTPSAVQLSSVVVPDPGDPARAHSVSAPLKSLADGVAYLDQEIARQRQNVDRERYLSLLTSLWAPLDKDSAPDSRTYTDVALVCHGNYAAYADHRLLMVGDDGNVRISTDWGTSWTAVAMAGSPYLTMAAANPYQILSPVAGYHAMVGGMSGKLFTTWNLSTWYARTLLTQPGPVSYTGTVSSAAFNPTTGTCILVCTTPSRLFRDGLGGDSWTDLGTQGFSTVSAAACSASGRFVVVGTDGSNPRAIYSTDNGVTWQAASALASAGGSTLLRVTYCAQADAFFAIQNGYPVVSVDGDTWTKIDVAAAPSLEGWAGTQYGFLEILNDGYGGMSARMTWKNPDGSYSTSLAPISPPTVASVNSRIRPLSFATYEALVSIGWPGNQNTYVTPRVVIGLTT